MKKVIRILVVLFAVVALSTSALADNFTPSVEQKGAPDIVVVEDSKGNEVAAVIVNPNNEEVAGVPTGDIIITSVADADKAENEEIKTDLKAAQEQIKNISNIADLVPDQKEELEKQVKDAGLKVENLVVRDMVDITLTGEYADHLKVEGNTITITFKLGIGANEFLSVLHNYEADKWEMIASDRVKVLENGDVQVTFDSLSPVAFVVDTVQHTGEEADDYGWLLYVLIGAAVVVVVIIIILVAKKKKVTEAAESAEQSETKAE